MNVCVWSISGSILRGNKNFHINFSHFKFYQHKIHLDWSWIELEFASCQDGDNLSGRWLHFCLVIPGL